MSMLKAPLSRLIAVMTMRMTFCLMDRALTEIRMGIIKIQGLLLKLFNGCFMIILWALLHSMVPWT